MTTKLLAVFVAGLVVGAVAGYRAAPEDPNATVQYGETSGMPKNCRAIVQSNIDGYKNKTYTADEVMVSLERTAARTDILGGSDADMG